MSDASATRKIAIGSDHGGFELKQHLRGFLEKRGLTVEDVGAFSSDPVDYPRIARDVARRVASGRCNLGLVIDGAGIGSCMAANKVPGIRAALCYDVSSARNSREHNNANVLTLGARLIGSALAEQILDVWLSTECTEERHLRRVAMIEDAVSLPVGPSSPTEPAPQASCEVRSAVEQSLEGIELAELSEADIDRVVERITTMLGSGGAAQAGADLSWMLCKQIVKDHPERLQELIDLGAERIGHGPGAVDLPREIARYIDHTLLRPDATRDDIVTLCREARENLFASVCVNPNWVSLCAQELKGTPVEVCTVAGFPLGAHAPEIKAAEARRAIREGAREIDMVINIGALKSGDDELVYRDIAAVVDACRDGRAMCKVIIEAALLNDDEKVRACKLSKRARADFVKTSTGFGPGGATAQDVALMSEAVREAGIGVKAAGGIRSYADAKKMIEAGATRIGASAGVRILKEASGTTVSQ